MGRKLCAGGREKEMSETQRIVQFWWGENWVLKIAAGGERREGWSFGVLGDWNFGGSSTSSCFWV